VVTIIGIASDHRRRDIDSVGLGDQAL